MWSLLALLPAGEVVGAVVETTAATSVASPAARLLLLVAVVVLGPVRHGGRDLLFLHSFKIHSKTVHFNFVVLPSCLWGGDCF